MSEELKLKQCPFCGGRAAFRGGTGAISAGCPYCNIHTIYCYPQEDAARIWNRRPAEDAKIARIAELEAERNRLREVVETLVQLYRDEHQGHLDNGLRIDGFCSHEWLGMILDHGA